MAKKVKKVYLTFDVDYTDYVSGTSSDEMETAFPLVKKVFERFPLVKTTWFIRVDYQIEALYKDPLYIFKLHADKIEWLKNNGHEIGWHFHPYIQDKGGLWHQDTETYRICMYLEKYGNLISNLGIRCFRMGWGFHTNKTFQKLNSLGFITIDSSAIPRPVYSWEMSCKDWSITPQEPYYPFVEDYRRSGIPGFSLLQVPINTTVINVPSDTEVNVMRYINPAYKHDIFVKAVNNFMIENNLLVAISHPYELMQNNLHHSLLSFDINEFEKNLSYLVQLGFPMKKLSDILEDHLA